MDKMTWFVGCCEEIIAADKNLPLIHRPFFASWDGLVWGFLYTDSASGECHGFCHSLISFFSLCILSQFISLKSVLLKVNLQAGFSYV